MKEKHINKTSSSRNGVDEGVRTLDFSHFLHGDNEHRHQFGKELIDALGRVGFVKIINHGIGDDDICQMFDFVRQFQICPPRSHAAALPLR